MKSLLTAAVILTFAATNAAAACGWKSSETVADLDKQTDKQQTAMQSTPSDATRTDEETAERTTDRSDGRLQIAVEPRVEDAANN